MGSLLAVYYWQLLCFAPSLYAMAPMEQIILYKCQALSYCSRNGICMRHVRTQEISCQCYDGWSGPECAASLMTDPLLTPGPVEESPDEPYLISPGIIGLVLLLLASLCVVAYVVKKCQKYPQSSVIQLRASRKADRAAALDLLETDPHHAKFSIDLDED